MELWLQDLRFGLRVVWRDKTFAATVLLTLALCLGAKGTFIGRPFLYGLGALGKEGVTMALEIIRKELDITMALCGKRNINDVGPELLFRP